MPIHDAQLGVRVDVQRGGRPPPPRAQRGDRLFDAARDHELHVMQFNVRPLMRSAHHHREEAQRVAHGVGGVTSAGMIAVAAGSDSAR